MALLEISIATARIVSRVVFPVDTKKYFSIVQPVVTGLSNPSSGNLKNNRGMTPLHKTALAA